VCDVRVHALDTLGTTSGRRAGIIDGFERVATRPVTRQREGEAISSVVIGRKTLVDRVHPPACFDGTGATYEYGARQPEQRRERGAVVQSRMVLDDHRNPEMAATRDAPRAAQRTTELGFDDGTIVRGMGKLRD